MQDIERIISPFIESQFPEFYKEDGPVFVDFVKAYYEWLELQENPVGIARDIFELRDVDTTVDQFLQYFKSKYLPLISFNTATDKRFLVKHVLDLYRSKGTERSVDLFFRLVYGVPASVYFPSSDIFRLSNGTYTIPKYIEVTNTPFNTQLIGKSISGARSGATAFCENYIRKKIHGKYVDILYINNIVGQFINNEKIIASDTDIKTAPELIGSVNTLTMINAGSLYKVGDVVALSSVNGDGATARVVSINDILGTVQFELLDGGWGYSNTANVFVSDSILQVDTLTSNASQYFKKLETITQPNPNANLTSYGIFVGQNANLTISISNAVSSFDIGTQIFQTDGVNDTANATILTSSFLGSNGGVVVNNVSGVFNTGVLYNRILGGANTSTNAVITNIQTQFGICKKPSLQIGNIAVTTPGTGYSNTNVLYVLPWEGVAIDGNVAVGTITTNSIGAIVNATITSAGNNYINISNCFFRISNTTVNTSNTSLGTGAVLVVNNLVTTTLNFNFVTTGNNQIIGSNTTGNVQLISHGTLANVSVSSNLALTETITTYDDLGYHYRTVLGNANGYGFPANTAAKRDTVAVANFLTRTTRVIGQITSLNGINPGTNYDLAPYIYVTEPQIAKYKKLDYMISTTPATTAYIVGEIVSQNNNAKGIVKQVVNNTTLLVRSVSFANTFVLTGNTLLTGSKSAATSNVVWLVEQTTLPVEGDNAIVGSSVTSGVGSIDELEVTDSGFGYIDQEIVTFAGNTATPGSAKVSVSNYGHSKGYHKDRESQLSSDKHLFDGDYYQEYSYDVRTSITLDKFSEIFKNTIHMAGTKFFGTMISTSSSNSQIRTAETTVTIG